jgi:hypothetical protein
MEKRIRFGDLVRNSGRPRVVTLWTEPKKQKGFAKAIRENRVLTVVQKLHNQKDYGLIKFDEEAPALYLVFPRPLPKDPNARVIGINYELAEEPEVTDPVPLNQAPSRPAPRPQPAIKPPEPQPVKKRFKVTVRRVATLQDEIEIEAPNQKAARAAAAEALKNKPFKLENASVRDQILKAE